MYVILYQNYTEIAAIMSVYDGVSRVFVRHCIRSCKKICIMCTYNTTQKKYVFTCVYIILGIHDFFHQGNKLHVHVVSNQKLFFVFSVREPS